VTRDDNAAGLRWVLEHIVFAAVALYPPLATTLPRFVSGFSNRARHLYA
jgi:hypothetical protein